MDKLTSERKLLAQKLEARDQTFAALQHLCDSRGADLQVLREDLELMTEEQRELAGLNIRRTSNSLLQTSTFGPFSAVSTPIFPRKYALIFQYFSTSTKCAFWYTSPISAI